MTQRKKLYIIDGAGYYFRAYFGIRQFLSNSTGLPTNAIYGFAMMLKKIIKEKDPNYLVMALDSKEPTFRHKMYAAYKANRPAMPEDLAQQLPYIDRLIDGFNIAKLKIPGWEADDIIGAVATKARADGFAVVIVTSDKDMTQLVNEQVTIYDSMKDTFLDTTRVEEKMGVPPEKVVDILGLMGDSSDNIPGIPGVGAKTAVALVKEYGSLENAITAAPGMTKKKLRENLTTYAEQGKLSKELATIALDTPVVFEPEKWKVEGVNNVKLAELYAELEFSTLLKEVKVAAPGIPRDYRLVTERADFDAMIATLRTASAFAVDTETTSLNTATATLVGASFCCKEGLAYYLPLRHVGEMGERDRRQLPLEDVLPVLKELLEDSELKKFGHNIKYDWRIFLGEGIRLRGAVFDSMIASYLIDPGARHGLSAEALQRLDEHMVAFSDVCGTGKKQITFDRVPLDDAANYAAEDADMTFRLVQLFEPELARLNLRKLFDEVEMPLVETLVTIEQNGVLVDTGKLAKISQSLQEAIDRTRGEIIKLAGEEFNLNSPKQLGEILFGKLGFPGGKKTKTGYSTSVDILENLADDYALPRLMLEYRSATKLKNTYVDTLPTMIDKNTGRIHTSFNQTVAATGRLSSSAPNLQNIPIRTPTGRKIREAFVAPEGSKIVAADYSQIELRLLAHFAKEKTLIKAFINGDDIHALTAAEIFDVALPLVTSDMRRIAKTVNFGVIYGQTPFGLAKELKISRAEAARYIDNYFARYPGIQTFIDKTVAAATAQGYVTTLLGRRRPLPDLKAKNRQVRQFAERNAVNTPMQGSAADLIKVAMIDIDQKLGETTMNSKMILQVHDELVFESPDGEVEDLIALVRSAMESVYTFSVPLIVDVGVGNSWGEAH